MNEYYLIALLLTVLLCEMSYILFRNPVFTKAVLFIVAAAVIISTVHAFSDFSLINFAKLSSLIVLVMAKVFFKSRPFEKPDYRYLIILAAVIIFHI